ncbi:sigma-70 family RNA polymerase sigma factor [Neorhizobium sp. DT-125]|uniref:sigma-70 family RNA polymerase sigma factor n=1 Tax=Neorhizobium sp. DT-125 TaxID=3396163 RepID=UPI003F1A382A
MQEDESVVDVFLQHRASLIEYAAARAGREHAEDVVQEAFIRLSAIQGNDPQWAFGPRGEIRNLNSYLFGVVRNLCTDRLRALAQDRSRRSPEEALQNVPQKERSPEEEVLVREQLRLVKHAIEGLPPRIATAFKMRWIDGVSFKLIAAQLGVSVARADQLVRQAEVRLSQQLPDFKPRCR